MHSPKVRLLVGVRREGQWGKSCRTLKRESSDVSESEMDKEEKDGAPG